MKRVYLYITIVSAALLFSCSGDDDAGVAVGSFNEAPTIPKLVFPADNLTCTSFNLEFAWEAASDANGDTVSYVIEVASESSFASILFTAITSDPLRVFTLEKGITYYWRVKARDSQGSDSEYSEVQSFFTEPDASVNSLPSVLELISPELGDRVSGTNITLDWDASDADGDDLLYDVYFGTTNSPTLIEENITTSQLEVTVTSNTIYYWRVVVKDSNQNATMGQVWNFRTE